MDLLLETERLRIVPFTLEDAPFIIQLLNDPLWIANIGDRNVRTIEDAENYLRNGPFQLFEKYGYGPSKAILKSEDKPIGMVGLFKRDFLENADIGFAFLSEYVGQGFGKEASLAVIDYAKNRKGMSRLSSIVSPSNERSLNLLKSLGFAVEKTEVIYGKETVILHKDI